MLPRREPTLEGKTTFLSSQRHAFQAEVVQGSPVKGHCPRRRCQARGRGPGRQEAASVAEQRDPFGKRGACRRFRPSFINRARSSPARSISCGIGLTILERSFMSCSVWRRNHACSCHFSVKVKKVQSELLFLFFSLLPMGASSQKKTFVSRNQISPRESVIVLN